MKKRVIENKALRITVKILIAIVVLILAFLLLLNPVIRPVCLFFIDDFPDIWEEKRAELALKWRFRFATDIGKPGDIDFYSIDFPEDSNTGLFYGVRAFSVPNYRAKRNFKLEICGERVSAQYTGVATYIDGERAYGFSTEEQSFGECEYTVRAGYITEDKEIARLTYIVPELKSKSDDEKREISASIARDHLGDLSDYTFNSLDISYSGDIHVYSCNIGEIRVEDYVLVSFPINDSEMVTVDINLDDHKKLPDVSGEEALSFVCTRVGQFWEEFKFDICYAKSWGTPYGLSLHKDPKGNMYVHGYIEVVRLYYANESRDEYEDISEYEFIVYLPEDM